MMNYKVRVESEVESKEVQELFFGLGWFWNSGCKEVKHPSVITYPCYITLEDSLLYFAEGRLSNCEELTIAQLCDKVVLHRNDVRDANCKDDTLHDLYIDSNKVVYFYHHGELKWVESAINGHDVYLNMVKPIEKEEMKEYLRKNDNGTYSYIGEVHPDHVHKNMVEVPEGAEAAFLSKCEQINFVKDGCFYHDGNWDSFKNESDHYKLYWLNKILWQRNPPVDAEFKTEKAIAESELMVRENSKHSHYFKDVSELNSIDVYKVLQLFEVTDPCLQHIVKKALCAGQRGHKDFKKDIQDILDTAKRCVEIN